MRRHWKFGPVQYTRVNDILLFEVGCFYVAAIGRDWGFGWAA